ncbi:MptD family putative ECF transporter S component [Senegalia sp. (in: firmicutes)]|uniref:MptD family putative ECF transporter S component n=1 Tax=Senegalia sp. (in: firmicutes) TaxID=1924098 RepID=UPI003F94B077
METKKLQTKDFINVGVFTAIYFVIFFAVGMLGYIPILYVLIPFIAPVISGIPFMLFLTRVKKFGMVTIMGTIVGTLMTLTGHTYLPAIFGFVFGLLADLIFKAGKYKSKKLSYLGYGVFSLWLMGMLAPFWIMKDSFENMMLDSMGVDYTKTVMDLFSNIAWTFPIMTFLGGMIGAFLGFTMLKKHFKKAGIA